MKMTKDKIVERLIKNKHITVEEAVVLLKEVHYSGTFQAAAPYDSINRNYENPYTIDNSKCICGGNCTCK